MVIKNMYINNKINKSNYIFKNSKLRKTNKNDKLLFYINWRKRYTKDKKINFIF